MNRLNRLTAILTQLQSKRHISAEEIANRFEISLRTVYRDIRALEEAGVPITGEAGKGYTLVEGYRLPPVMFDEKEAFSLILAEKIIEKFSDREISQHFQSALIKIKSVLKDQQKSAIDQLDEQVIYYKRELASPSKNEKAIQRIMSALATNKVLQFDYISFIKEENTSRSVEPIGMYFSLGNWYLIAFCKLRKDYRTFRVDRIQKINITEEHFTTNHPSLKSYLKKMEEGNQLKKVIIQMDPSHVKYIDNHKYNQGFVLQEKIDNKVQLTFMVDSIEFFVRWIISIGDIVTVISPKALSERMSALLNTMTNKLQESNSQLKA
ncbi:YafY family protein [Cyclobacterium sp. 1_MG-2023]|uniref:helix-turn-helix transcriptional regulator n=1 Tax=Cyclobacterium sp. 1_MG-2023 TaxID=3062681 RepID=UPI0026E33B52|nr:YafY family protein [Cyclobacterium sp. 1_MG-2023]MDO6438316.1 YafY family protein [Cyclobacterium sp. 1_MG-2023]